MNSNISVLNEYFWNLKAENLWYLVTIHTVLPHLTLNSWYRDKYRLCLIDTPWSAKPVGKMI